MMKKLLIALFATMITMNGTAFGQTIDGCSLRWDYPVEEEQNTDDFVFERMEEDGSWQESGSVPASVREATCIEAGAQAGVNTFRLRARNALGVSDPSNEAVSGAIVTDPPPAPTNLSTHIQVNIVVN